MRRRAERRSATSWSADRTGPPVGSAFVAFVAASFSCLLAVAIVPTFGLESESAIAFGRQLGGAGATVFTIAALVILVRALVRREVVDLFVGVALLGPGAVWTAVAFAADLDLAPWLSAVVVGGAGSASVVLLWRGLGEQRWTEVFSGLALGGQSLAAAIITDGSATPSPSLEFLVCVAAAAGLYGALVQFEIDLGMSRRELAAAKHELEADRMYFDDLMHDLRSGLLGIEAASVAVMDERADVLAAEAARLRAMTDREQARTEPFDLASGLRGLAAASQVEGLSIDLRSPDRVEVVGVESQILSVVQNLIDNGRRHGQGTVSIEVVEDGERLLLSVADEGDGPMLSAEELFERGVSGDPSGSGLGLDVARRLTEANGGELRFAPTADRPGRFVIDLPALSPDHQPHVE